MPGNQHNSRKVDLLAFLATACDCLAAHDLAGAREWMGLYRYHYSQAPASTRRRWRCGR